MNEKKILVVEDNTEVSDVICKKLTTEGFTVEKKAKGSEVYPKAKEFLPDLVLMDIMLEDMDGPEAVQILQDDPTTTNIPVLFLSGIIVEAEEDSSPTVRVGGKVYPAIGKPFTFSDLLSEIYRLLQIPQK